MYLARSVGAEDRTWRFIHDKYDGTKISNEDLFAVVFLRGRGISRDTPECSLLG